MPATLHRLSFEKPIYEIEEQTVEKHKRGKR